MPREIDGEYIVEVIEDLKPELRLLLEEDADPLDIVRLFEDRGVYLIDEHSLGE